MDCPRCKSANLDAANFCQSCGGPLRASAPAARKSTSTPGCIAVAVAGMLVCCGGSMLLNVISGDGVPHTEARPSPSPSPKKVAVKPKTTATPKATLAPEEQAFRARCGASVTEDGWYGGYKPITSYLKDHLHDPGSYELVSCSVPARDTVTVGGCYMIECRFRAKNRFGALALNRYIFEIANDRVTNATDVTDVDLR